MPIEEVETVIVGGGQAGLAMSAHLGARSRPHLILERHRIAERWRSERWDALVANGPAWHDRFPARTFETVAPDGFASRDAIVTYFEGFARQIDAPIRCGVDVTHVTRTASGDGFDVDTSEGTLRTRNLVAATGPFQRPIVPSLVPAGAGLLQIHSCAYRTPAALPEGAVMVVGAGSSGAQIADELARAGRKVYLSVGPHDRPPRRYRGKDFVWWLGALGKWDAEAATPGQEHVTIAVSGAHGGQTVDFRDFAARGITLVGRTEGFHDGRLSFARDLAQNLALGDANLLSLLDEADAYVAAQGLDLPAEPEAHVIGPDPDCVRQPLLELDLAEAGVTTIIWAVGYGLDFGWLTVGRFDDSGRPIHDKGVGTVPGLYFLGLPWLSHRGSSFIWGVWKDAERLAAHIAARPAQAGAAAE